MDPGETIPAISGTIKTILAHKSGTNEFGDWSIQFLRIADSAGNEIKVKIGNRDEIPKSWKGETIYFEAGKDDKGNLVDLKRGAESYKGNTEAIIDVRGRSTMEVAGGSSQEAQDRPESSSRPQQAALSRPTQQDEPKPQAKAQTTQSKDLNADREVKIAAARLKNLCVLSRKAAVQAREELKDLGLQCDEAAVQSMASSIFIQLTREGHQHRIDHHPMTFK